MRKKITKKFKVLSGKYVKLVIQNQMCILSQTFYFFYKRNFYIDVQTF